MFLFPSMSPFCFEIASTVLVHVSFPIIPGSFGDLTVNGSIYPLYLGIVPGSLFCLVASFFLCLALIDLFGSLTAVVVCFVNTFIFSSVFFIIGAVIKEKSLQLGLISPDTVKLVMIAAIFLGVFPLCSFFYFIFRKAAHNGWLLLRCLFVGFIGSGGASIVLAQTGFGKNLFLRFGSYQFADSVVYFLQFFTLFVLGLLFFYDFLLLFQGLIGKKHLELIEASFKKKKVFTPESPASSPL